eukprot:scaffold109065_cov75-Phaeocystis_antarctica.AAC.7
MTLRPSMRDTSALYRASFDALGGGSRETRVRSSQAFLNSGTCDEAHSSPSITRSATREDRALELSASRASESGGISEMMRAESSQGRVLNTSSEGARAFWRRVRIVWGGQ